MTYWDRPEVAQLRITAKEIAQGYPDGALPDAVDDLVDQLHQQHPAQRCSLSGSQGFKDKAVGARLAKRMQEPSWSLEKEGTMIGAYVAAAMTAQEALNRIAARV